MSRYSFRIRFRRAPGGSLNVDSNELVVGDVASSGIIVLSARERESTIRKAEQWVVEGSGWDSDEEALAKGQDCMDALALTFARMRIGVDFGRLTPKSGFLQHGLDLFQKQTGRRVLDDVHGLMVFEAEPRPLFASAGSMTAILVRPRERFEKAFRFALQQKIDLSGSERISLELFNASFFQNTVETRFLLLMMSVEALLQPEPRSNKAVQHVDNLIGLTVDSQELSQEEKDSLLGSLRWMRKQSINQTGRRLMEKRLGERIYLDMTPPAFFTHCYGVRSRLVHGAAPFPTRDEVGGLAAELEVCVSDLLSGPLLELEL